MKMHLAFGLPLLMALAAANTALAQQAQPAPGFAPPETAPAPAFHANQVGDATRYVLQLQTGGTQSAKPLPMLGDEATAAYRRYLKSFDHPIPDFYESPVGKTADTVK
ncbi:DUF3613 domain-containing protein [Dyella mobilis]|uniref:DUF3613 domain-containing protein n=1 Tax=Dyella mobilis TaxID=1849582 RepID=A0ABS2KBA4_9GAMM|nr:DUF3613 domain-containing protein [Dyella mobilis]MBM7128447.1 DUF3613 domain-containing protein [Dyella mobilis]GLQ99753.1 hypothetical protein GCM10007863_41730 [Dyella mobilis]